jgi:hypothetical protein
MDFTLSPEFCAACRIILGGDTPDIVILALRTATAEAIHRVHADIREGRCDVTLPLDPPAGTLAPPAHMLGHIHEAFEERGSCRITAFDLVTRTFEEMPHATEKSSSSIFAGCWTKIRNARKTSVDTTS